MSIIFGSVAGTSTGGLIFGGLNVWIFSYPTWARKKDHFSGCQKQLSFGACVFWYILTMFLELKTPNILKFHYFEMKLEFLVSFHCPWRLILDFCLISSGFFLVFWGYNNVPCDLSHLSAGITYKLEFILFFFLPSSIVEF